MYIVYFVYNSDCTAFTVLPNFMGLRYQKNHPLHLLQKKALRIITNSHYIAHSEPIFRTVRFLKITDMFSVAIESYISS